MTDLDTVRTLIARHDAGWNTQDPDEILATYTTEIVLQNHTAGEDEVPLVPEEAHDRTSWRRMMSVRTPDVTGMR